MRFYLPLLIWLYSLIAVPVQADVLSSIAPLNFIVKDIAGEKIATQVLLPGNASPHHYALKISDMRKLSDADVFIWVGPSLEGMLTKAVTGRDGPTLTVTDIIASGKTVKNEQDDAHSPKREEQGPKPGLHRPEENVNHDDEHLAHSLVSNIIDHKHNRQGDAHHWLNYENAVDIAVRVHAELLARYPEHKHYFDNRLQGFEAAVHTARSETAAALEPLRSRPFGVYHDGYSAFVKEFNLNQNAHVTVVPDQSLSIKALIELSERLEGAHCLIGEYSEFEQAQTIAKKLKLPAIAIDLLGVDVEVNAAQPTNFTRYMNGIADSFIRCLH